MHVVDLYNNIYFLITSNENILYYLGISKDSTDLEKAKKVQKRAKPPNLVNNIPLIAFYAPPGSLDKGNSAVYVAPFVFDIYTQDDVKTAHLIAQELIKMIDNKLLPFENIENFESRFITAHESGVDIENVYCFTVVFEFSIVL